MNLDKISLLEEIADQAKPGQVKKHTARKDKQPQRTDKQPQRKHKDIDSLLSKAESLLH